MSERTEELLSGGEHSKLEIPKANIERLVGQILAKYKTLALHNAKLDIAYNIGMANGIMNLANLLLYIWGGYAILKDEMTVGQLTGFVIYFSTLCGVGEGMLDFFKSYKAKMLSLQRIEDFQSISSEPENKEGIAHFLLKACNSRV